ncbi:MAG TPA: gluconate 2-dehydrogenase subunit 3 family protein [Steroidobacteraceae bacterium]|nr:gluconate 2-dehydrogenase subunit 3 family protein [Steroidobacteraceae bacterium]
MSDGIRRRDVLTGAALALVGGAAARAGVIKGQLPWRPDEASPPPRVEPGPWQFFTAEELPVIEALADRIIPSDPQTPGGKDAGCVVFLDRQLAGAYGSAEGLYERGPFIQGVEQQGPQSSKTPAQTYRAALQALGGKQFAGLAPAEQDELLQGLEKGSMQLPGIDARQFFVTLVKDIQEGFFADPIYGGNRDMCAWKMIGFPGARYDYRDWVGRHNQRFPLPPVSLGGRAEWTPKEG